LREIGSLEMPASPFFSASGSEKYSYVLAPTLRVLRHLKVSGDAGAALMVLDLLAIRQAAGWRQPLPMQTVGRGRVRPHLTGLMPDPGLIKRF
jgi:hypothetical protein